MAVCLVAAVSLAMIANPAAAYANDEPIVPSTPIEVIAPSTPLPVPEPTSTPIPTPESISTDAITQLVEPEPTAASEESEPIPLPGEEGTISLTSPLGDQGYLSVGLYGYPGHSGTDYAAPAGTEIYAAQSGTVVYASNEVDALYGKCVIVDHGNGWQTLYAHCSSVLVELDDEVEQGSLIAKVGRTGNATGNHCHVELRYNGEITNVENYIVKAE